MKQLIARLSAKWVEKKPLEQSTWKTKFAWKMARVALEKWHQKKSVKLLEKLAKPLWEFHHFLLGSDPVSPLAPSGIISINVQQTKLNYRTFRTAPRLLTLPAPNGRWTAEKKLLTSLAAPSNEQLFPRKTPVISLSSRISFPRWTMYR